MRGAGRGAEVGALRTVSVDRLGETVRDLYKEACVVVNPELEGQADRHVGPDPEEG